MDKKIKNSIKAVWFLLVLVFVFRYFVLHFNDIKSIVSVLPVLNVCGAFLFLFSGKVMLSLVAYSSVKYTDGKLPLKKVFSIYNLTQLAKYIPGSIWQFVGKAGAYKKEGLSTEAVKNSIIIEMVCVLFSSFVFGILFFDSKNIAVLKSILSKFGKSYHLYLLMFLCFFCLIVLLRKKIKAIGLLFKGKTALNLQMVCLLFLVWIFLGMTLFITITPYIKIVTSGVFFMVAGLYAMAYFVGFLAPFAPAGVGIREAVLIAGISSLIPLEQAIVIASLNRVIYFITEIIIAGALSIFK